MPKNARVPLAAVAAALALLSCKPKEKPLSPVEQAAKDRAECQLIATQQTGFDPVMAEEPPRTISETHQRGGDTIGSGRVAKGAAKGALVGVAAGAVAGDAGKGAAAGAVAGGLIGGVRRRRETKEMVTTTHTNPDYTAYLEAKNAFRAALDACMRSRAPGAREEQP
jgi:hypothetical protein